MDNNTFIINVTHRQNETWQGSVTWADERKTEYFRSELELLKLMEEAMGDDEPGRVAFT